MIDPEALDALLDEPLDHRAKGFPFDGRFPTIRHLQRAAPRWEDAGFATPIAVLDGQRLRSNVAAMTAFCARENVAIAPHGKTTMAPQLFQQQLAAGAWGITLATAWQARVARAFGVERLFIANQVTDPVGLRWLAEDANTNATPILSYVDDPGEVRRSNAILTAAASDRPIDVLVEVGQDGGRTGCRDLEAVRATAEAVAASDRHRLVGVAGYEGTLGPTVDESTMTAVRQFLASMRTAFEHLRDKRLFATDVERPIISAGGSIFFDLVAEEFAPLRDHAVPPLVVIRSGAYVSHDDLLYRDVSPFSRSARIPEDLAAATEVWTHVVSRPEPGMAFLDAGRRDLPFDAGLPVVRRHLRDDELPDADPTSWEITALNDQHAFLQVPASSTVQPGDTVVLGISHPCTLFDKWRVIPVVEDGRVVDAIRTFF